MNNFRYARQRDNAILAALENYQCLDTYQLAILFFPSRKMARKRMLELYKRKKVKRARIDIDQPNIYYLDKLDEHIAMINWARLYLERKCAWGDTPISFDYKAMTITYENPLTKKSRQTKIITGKQLNFGGSTFPVDEQKIENMREELLCGRH